MLGVDDLILVSVDDHLIEPPDLFEDARRSIETYRRSEAEGVGAIGRDGRLVDAAHMRPAENILHKAALADDERGDAGTAPLLPDVAGTEGT